MAITIFIVTGRKIGLNQRFLMQESISAPQMGGIVRLTGFIIKSTILMESVGAILLAIRFCPQMGLGKGLWFAVFHSITAFCNAGFDLMGEKGEFSSLTHYEADPIVNLTIMLLIIIGGIGFFVWDDRRVDLRLRRWRRRFCVSVRCFVNRTIYNVLAGGFLLRLSGIRRLFVLCI